MTKQGEVQEMTVPFIVGIAGGSGSGKTTVAKAVAAKASASTAVLSCDDYYRHRPDLDGLSRAELNFDHPDALDFRLLSEHLALLGKGQAVEVPQYDFEVHLRREVVTRVEPPRVLVVEGILLLHDERVRGNLDLSVFVEAPADVRLLRRIARDVAERGRTVHQVGEQYLSTVRPAHELYVAPTAILADVVVDGTNDEVADEVLRMVHRRHRAPGLQSG